MTKSHLPSPELLRKLLKYDPETGKLYWRERPVDMFKSERGANPWNARYAHKEAFTYVHTNGYNRGNIYGIMCLAHRVIWCIVHGEWPDQIDHINGVRDDNRIVNLRDVDNQENHRNISIGSHNTSGHIGVCWAKREGVWRPRIMIDGTEISLGYYCDIKDAINARACADIKYGFHKNHGKAPQDG